MSVFDMNGLLLRSGDRVAESIGQSSARWQVLGRAGYKPHTVARMAKDMGHARQSVQRIADVLVEEGFAEYRDNPDDRRAMLLALTAKGAAALESLYELDRAWSRAVMKRLDPGRLEALARELDGIARVFRAELEKEGGQDGKRGRDEELKRVGSRRKGKGPK